MASVYVNIKKNKEMIVVNMYVRQCKDLSATSQKSEECSDLTIEF